LPQFRDVPLQGQLLHRHAFVIHVKRHKHLLLWRQSVADLSVAGNIETYGGQL